ncbi:MAG: hypothetical protein QM477_11070 [Planctomycetota bacterium]
MRAVLSVARFSFMRRASGLKLLGPGVVALLPCLMMSVVLFEGDPIEALDLYRNYMVPATLYFVLPLVCMFVMLPVLSELYDKGAIGYLYTRPAPRWKILLGMFLGAYAATIPVFFIGVLAPVMMGLAFAETSGIHDWIPLGTGIFAILAVASLAYGSICIFIGVSTKRPILWAFFVLVGLGSVMGSVPGSGQQFSLHYYLISLAYRWCGITGSESNLFSPLETIASVPMSLLILVATSAVVMVFTSIAAQRRDVL